MTRPIDRFETQEARIEALLRQKIINGDREAATALEAAGDLVDFKPGQSIITQGDYTSDAYFLLSGSIQLWVNGKLIPYRRESGEVVGEFAAINTSLRRTATVVAAEHVVALKCSSASLKQVANAHKRVWELIAIDLTWKVEQRNLLINCSNDKPRLFMIATEERMEVARELEVALAAEFSVDLWSDEDLYPPGTYELDRLHGQAARADFGIILAHPDDLRRSRGRKDAAPAETVQFELGYIISELGRTRTMLLIPENGCGEQPPLFKGLRPWCYPVPDGKGPAKAQLAAMVDRIRQYVTDTKVRSKLAKES